MTRQWAVQRGATRVVFGIGASRRLAAELDALGLSRVMGVCSPRRAPAAKVVLDALGARSAGLLAIAQEHVPVEVATEGRRAAARIGAEAVLAVGGGSAIGLAKAIAITTGVRVVAVPTTYSGSEMTPIHGITDGGEKKTGRDERVRPALVAYDPDLTRDLPRDVAVASLWNAIAHAVEALWSNDADRAALRVAEEALGLLTTSIARLAGGADDPGARAQALEGACLAGSAFADAGSGLHHKLCHALGGMFALPHAATHAALLPHVVRLYRGHDAAMAALSRALHAVDPVVGIDRLAAQTGAPRSLAKLGMPKEGIERAVEAVLASPVHGFDRAALVAMLTAAWNGPTPRAMSPLRAPVAPGAQPGFGSTHESEAIRGALPRRQNTPHPPPCGLYPELLNGTPFTVKSAQNSRVWMYRVRPSFSHGPLARLPEGRFGAAFLGVEPNRTRWKPMPLPDAHASVDLLDGLVTLGGAGDPASGPGFAVHLYACNADMGERAFANTDGDILVVPQDGALDLRTELGWLHVPPGSIAVVPRAVKLAVGTRGAAARGWLLEVWGSRLRLPERGPIGSNGLADARHFLAPTASYEDRLPEGGFEIVTKVGGRLHAATQAHSPFDVVAWHGNHVPYVYDLSLFNAMGSVTWDHPDPSILTVLTAPLDDHGRATLDFVVFPGRWEVGEHSFRPPFMHRNAASEINMVVRTASVESGYEPGCTFVSPLLTAHGITAAGYEHALGPERAERPVRIPDASLWTMAESALPFRFTAWAHETPLVDRGFLALFEGMRSRFDPAGQGAS